MSIWGGTLPPVRRGRRRPPAKPPVLGGKGARQRVSDETFLARIQKGFAAGELTGQDIFRMIRERAPAPTRPIRRAPPRPAPGETGIGPVETAPGPGPVGPFGRALKKRRRSNTGTASTNPLVLRDRAARLRARIAANRR